MRLVPCCVVQSQMISLAGPTWPACSANSGVGPRLPPDMLFDSDSALMSSGHKPNKVWRGYSSTNLEDRKELLRATKARGFSPGQAAVELMAPITPYYIMRAALLAVLPTFVQDLWNSHKRFERPR